jgi:hypothetical protein
MTRKEINKLDDLWSKVVKDKAGYICEHCGIRGVRMEAAHVCGRRHRGTRWGVRVPAGTIIEVPNDIPIQFFKPVLYDLCGHCFCHSCHQQYDEHGPLEKDIVEFTIGHVRKARIQAAAKQRITKYQEFDIVKELLEGVHNVDNPNGKEQEWQVVS